MVGIISTPNLSPSVNNTNAHEINQQRLVQQTQNTSAIGGAVPSEDQFVNLNTSQAAANAETNEQYSHQRYVAYNAYINLGREDETTPALSPAESFAKIQDAGKVDEASLAPAIPTVNPLTGETSTPQGESGSAVQGQSIGQAEQDKNAKGEDKEEDAKKIDGNTPRAPNGEPLNEEEQAELREMKSRDKEVRVHEQAHKSAGGQYAGSPQYEYANGPDGKRYITDGSVSIDVSEESDPQATIDKMQVVKRAALAPAQPSSQDRSVYAEASQLEAQARQELNDDKQEEAQKQAEKATSGAGSEQAANGSKEASNNTAATSAANATSSNSDSGKAANTTATGTRSAEPKNGAAPVTNSVKQDSSAAQGSTDSKASKESTNAVSENKGNSVPKGPQTPSKLSNISALSSNNSDDDVPDLV